MTKQTNRKPGATAAASTIPLMPIPGSRTASWPTWSRVSARGASRGVAISSARASPDRGAPTANPTLASIPLILWLEAVEKGHRSPTWMTYRQAQQLGGQVRRGERGSQVVYMGETTKTRRDEGTGEETEQGVRFLKTYTVFNVGQIDGLPEAFAIPVPRPPPLPCPAPSSSPTRRCSLPQPEPTSGMGAHRPSTR